MKHIIALVLCLASAVFAAEGGRQPNPLTDAEKAKVAEIKILREQIHAKRLELLAMLDKDHPKLAACIRQHMEQMGQHRGQWREQMRDHPVKK